MSTTINNRWLSLLVICFCGGIIYIIPYLQFSYYAPIKEGLDISHFQMDDLMSILGITSSICYFLGGVAVELKGASNMPEVNLVESRLTTVAEVTL
ncbi:hypothetical protein [Aliivibrio fischeri]|uniref:hypothetical protein n=1 Tax=Aliivibrio fischeri TaxID=668 RepID=UPI00084C825D|nr:hypothetical protein [Aliivibrio fischeri]OED53751.1 hypothetical protein BEI47_17370 [Aliivibrio fischeri]